MMTNHMQCNCTVVTSLTINVSSLSTLLEVLHYFFLGAPAMAPKVVFFFISKAWHDASIKYQKLRKFYHMKWNFLYQITAASRTPDYGATAPRSPFCPQMNLLNPPLNKIPGYATGRLSKWYRKVMQLTQYTWRAWSFIFAKGEGVSLQPDVSSVMPQRPLLIGHLIITGHPVIFN
jgi:hypothetical protein